MAVGVLLFTVAAESAGALWFPGGLWGAHTWRFIAPGLLIVTLLAVGIFIIGCRTERSVLLVRAKRFQARWLVTGLLGWIAILWLARARTVLLGDGLPIIFSDPRGYTLLPHEPLAGFLRQTMTVVGEKALGHELLPQERWDAVALGSCLAGLVFTVLAWLLAAELARLGSEGPPSSRSGQVLAFLVLVSQGYVQLVFGYVENYPYALVAVCGALVLGLRVLRGATPLWSLPPIALALVLSHLSLAILVPGLSLPVLGLLRRSGSRLKALVAFLTACALSIGAVQLLHMTLGYDLLAQLWGLAESGRASGSHAALTTHLLNVLNEQLLIGPVSLLAFVAFGSLQIGKRPTIGVAFLVFMSLLAAMSCLLLGDLSLGYARDWDILAPLGLIFAATVTTLVGYHQYQHRMSLCILVVASLLHTVPWVGVNASGDASLKRFASLPLGGGRTESTIGYWYFQLGERDSSKAWLDRSLAANPFNNRAAALYGEIHLQEGHPERAAFAYTMASKSRPNLRLYRRRIVESLVRAGQFQEALNEAHDLMRMDAKDERSIVLLCLTHFEGGDTLGARVIAERASVVIGRAEELAKLRQYLDMPAPETRIDLWEYATERR